MSLKEAKAGAQVRSVEAATETEAREECYLLTCFSWLAQLPLYSSGPPAQR